MVTLLSIDIVSFLFRDVLKASKTDGRRGRAIIYGRFKFEVVCSVGLGIRDDVVDVDVLGRHGTVDQPAPRYHPTAPSSNPDHSIYAQEESVLSEKKRSTSLT